jgi:ribosomal protein S27AE
MKVCSKCKLKLDTTCFYKNNYTKDNLGSYCKICSRDSKNKWAEKNKDKLREKEKKYLKEYLPKYNRTERGKEVNKRKKFNIKHRIKYLAWRNTGHAIKTGKLKRKPCEDCGEIKVEAHHNDYSKILNVRWLCSKCHHKEHDNLRKKTLI